MGSEKPSKKSMTSFDVAGVVSELSSLFEGARLQNVYDAPGGVMLKVKGEREGFIVAVAGSRLHLTRYPVAREGMPSPLVMGFRKHIRGARIESIEQLSFDRIVVFKFSNGYNLVVELLPRGVIALLDENGAIVYATEYREMRDRVIRRGAAYQPPPCSTVHPNLLAREHVERALSGCDGAPAACLARGLGYPGEVVEEAIFRCGGLGDVEELVRVFRELYREALSGRGYLVYSGTVPVTVTVFRPQRLSSLGYEVKVFDSASEAFDEYFAWLARAVEAEKFAREVESERRRLMVSIRRARENIERIRSRLREVEELLALVGENYTVLSEALSCVEEVRRKAGWDFVVGSCPHVVDVKPDRGVVVISIPGSGRLVEVDARLGVDGLILELSRRRGELKAKLERSLEAVRQLEEKVEKLEEEVRRRMAIAAARVRRREWYEKYHWIVTSSGFLAIGGRNADQNESIVKRYLTDKDIFMHADIHGAPVVVILARGRQPPERDLREAACIAACYSKAWKSGAGYVDVYWVWGSQVSKSPPPGQYLAKGAFMVYGKRNYIRGVELRLAIGLGVEENSPIIIVGPKDLVSRRSLVYALLAPGSTPTRDLAERIRRGWARLLDERSWLVEALKVEEVQERLPGPSTLLEVERGDAVEPPRGASSRGGEEEA